MTIANRMIFPIAWVVLSTSLMTATAVAQQKGSSEGGQKAQKRENGTSEVDQILKNFRKRQSQNVEQTRSEIDAIRKELIELIELRIDMELAKAQMQAESSNPYSGRFGVQRDGGAQGSEDNNQEALARELLRVKENLSQELTRLENEASNLADQIRRMMDRKQQAEERSERRQDGRQGADELEDNRSNPSRGRQAEAPAEGAQNDARPGENTSGDRDRDQDKPKSGDSQDKPESDDGN